MWRPLSGVGLFLGLLAVSGVLGCSPGKPGGAAKQDPGPPLVTVAKPVVKTVTQFKEVNGTLKARERVEIRAQVTGFIDKIHFKDGAEVKAGDLLISIDPSLYKADLDKAEAELSNSQAQAKLATTEEARMAKLRQSASISQDEYDQIAAKKEVAMANVKLSLANVQSHRADLGAYRSHLPDEG
jgi:RND family efflux transporter MFP subunit